MVSSISYKSGHSSIELVSRDSKSISDYNWIYSSSVPSKCYSIFAVIGSAIIYFSTYSCVLKKLTWIFFLNRFLTISLNDILSSILFILLALDWAKALAIGCGYGANGNIGSSSILFIIPAEESSTSLVCAYRFYVISYFMLLVLLVDIDIASV